MTNATLEKKKYPIGDFIAGGISGGTTRLFVAPFDVVKIRFQVQADTTNQKYKSVIQSIKTIAKDEGFLALWRGNLTAEFLWIGFGAIQFATYQQTLQYLSDGSLPSTSHYFVSGGIAGLAATLITYPLDLTRTRLAAQGDPKVYANLRDCMRRSVKEGGLLSLWKGNLPTVVQIMPYIALQFTIYESMKKLFKLHDKDKRGNAQALGHFLCGAVSGVLSKLGVLPLDVIKKRLQMSGVHRSEKYGQVLQYNGMADCINKIARTEGWRGFYKGTAASIYKAAPGAALTFMFYEQFKKIVENLFDKN